MDRQEMLLYRLKEKPIQAQSSCSNLFHKECYAQNKARTMISSHDFFTPLRTFLNLRCSFSLQLFPVMSKICCSILVLVESYSSSYTSNKWQFKQWQCQTLSCQNKLACRNSLSKLPLFNRYKFSVEEVSILF